LLCGFHDGTIPCSVGLFRGIKNGLGDHDVAAVIEVIEGIANEESTGKVRTAAR